MIVNDAHFLYNIWSLDQIVSLTFIFVRKKGAYFGFWLGCCMISGKDVVSQGGRSRVPQDALN